MLDILLGFVVLFLASSYKFGIVAGLAIVSGAWVLAPYPPSRKG